MKKHFFFIYQRGWRQIVLPNGEVLNLTSCDDGCYITTEIDMKEAVEKLNQFKGHPVIDILCDSNSIEAYQVFDKAKLCQHRYGEGSYEAIFIDTSFPNGTFVNPIVIDGMQAEFPNARELFGWKPNKKEASL